MRILVFTTGGTIGSVSDGTAIDVCRERSTAVVDMYLNGHDDASFDVLSPVNILSELISAADLNALAAALLSADCARYDGVIVTCGSDNLGYIAPFIGLLTSGTEIPVAIVAADLMLSAPASNGYPNFCCAVELIRRGGRGSYVPYRNSDGVMYIHSAADLRQSDLSPDFYSFGGAYAIIDGGKIIPQRNYIQQTIPDIFSAGYLPRVTDSIALIHPYPLMDYSTVSVEGKRAVLHTLYHSSTLDSARAIPFLRSLGDIPMYLASFRAGRERYKTAVDTIAAGAIPLTDISPECAYVKLLLAAAQDRMSIADFMEA